MALVSGPLMDQRTRRPGRILAPIALIVAIVALYLIITGSNVEKTDKKGTRTTQTTRKRGGHRSSGRLPTKTYVVKQDDTLAGISSKVGIPVDKIENLNPDLDPQSLIAGQRIKLR
jgi:LysM repeat protein